MTILMDVRFSVNGIQIYYFPHFNRPRPVLCLLPIFLLSLGRVLRVCPLHLFSELISNVLFV